MLPVTMYHQLNNSCLDLLLALHGCHLARLAVQCPLFSLERALKSLNPLNTSYTQIKQKMCTMENITYTAHVMTRKYAEESRMHT